jgi:hypothetical protein
MHAAKNFVHAFRVALPKNKIMKFSRPGATRFVLSVGCILLALSSFARADTTPAATDKTAPGLPVALEGVAQGDLDLYLLVGQSNMTGRGKIEAIDRQTNPRVWSLDSAGQWVPARDPLHYDFKTRGVGPGLAFGKAMAQTNPQANIGLIPAAVGGTLVEWWLPGAKRHLFEDAVERARRAQTRGVLRGILWQQGESDTSRDRPAHYRQRLLTVLRAFRHELGDDNVPIVIGGLGNFLKASSSKKVNAALQTVAGEIPCAAFVPASTKGHIGDRLHFNSAAARENGQNMARAMIALQENQREAEIAATGAGVLHSQGGATSMCCKLP